MLRVAKPASDALSSIEEAIEEFRNGRMVVLVDDEERENEGDLVIPAQLATPETIPSSHSPSSPPSPFPAVPAVAAVARLHS